ncbi:MAG TPA: hypothetical protein VF681_02140 [Abditibacteriaceae bacterium]|jgi:hypothetical protein
MNRIVRWNKVGIVVALGATVLSSIMIAGCGGGNGSSLNLPGAGGGGGNATLTGTQNGTSQNLGAGRAGLFQLQTFSDNSVKGTLTVNNTAAQKAPRAVALPTGTYSFSGTISGNTFTGAGRFTGTPAFDFTVNGTLATATTNGSWTIAGTVNGQAFSYSSTFSDKPADPIPASMRGTYNLTYNEERPNGPVADNTKTSFVIDANTLSFSGKTLRNPIFRHGNKLEWIFTDGAFEYAASIATDKSLNEINVAGPAGLPFYGQYNDAVVAPVTNTLTGVISGAVGANVTPGNINLPLETSNTFVQTSGTRIFTAIFNDASRTTTRRFLMELRSPNDLAAGQTLTLGAHGTNASIVFTEASRTDPTTGTGKHWVTAGGSVRIDSVVGNIVRFTLQNAKFQARSNSLSTGSFVLNGTGQALVNNP